MQEIQKIKEKLEKYLTLVESNPSNPDLIYWVAFYREKIADELEKEGNVVGAKEWLVAAQATFADAFKKGYNDAESKVEEIEKRLKVMEVEVYGGGNRKKKVWLLMSLLGLFALILIAFFYVVGEREIIEIAPLEMKEYIEMTNENVANQKNESLGGAGGKFQLI